MIFPLPPAIIHAEAASGDLIYYIPSNRILQVVFMYPAKNHYISQFKHPACHINRQNHKTGCKKRCPAKRRASECTGSDLILVCDRPQHHVLGGLSAADTLVRELMLGEGYAA